MRLRPHGIGCRPKDGFACAAEGGTADGRRCRNFIHRIGKPDRAAAPGCDPDCPGPKFPKAEEPQKQKEMRHEGPGNGAFFYRSRNSRPAWRIIRGV